MNIQRYRRLGIEMLCATALVLISCPLIYWIRAGEYSESETDAKQLTWILMLTAVTITPIIETFLLRITLSIAMTVLEEIRFLENRIREVMACLVCASLFGMMHGFDRVGYKWEMAFGGFILCHILFSVRRRYSRQVAFWACTGVHFAHNAVLVSIGVLAYFFA